MNKLFSNLILIAILFSSYGCNKKRKTDRNDLNLSDNVKSVREYSYRVVEKFGEIEKVIRERRVPWDNDFYATFNIEGNKIKEIDYPNIAAETKIIFKYDNREKLIEKSTYLNENGALLSNSIYKYNDKQQRIEENKYDSDGLLESKIIFNHNEKGEVIEEKISYEVRPRTIINYNEEGEIIEKKVVMKKAWEDTHFTYKYDDKGNKIERNYYKADTLLEIETFQFNKFGKQIESKSFKPDERLESHWTYRYDDSNNIIERNCHLDETSGLKSYHCNIYSYQYEYNEHGDWIKQVELINNKPKYVLERIIEYFE